MFNFLADVFGILLNAIYSLVNNYGWALIIFSIILKLLLLPISIKQQKTMKKTTKIQGKLQEIQFKYKNDPEKMNQETLNLYKQENMSPFSGCFSAIVQIVILFAVFYLVSSPLTHMKKVDSNLIEQYKQEISQNDEIKNSNYPEIDIIKVKGQEDERVYINMNFLGIDLSNVPSGNLNDYRVYIIPVLYVITSFISVRMTTAMQKNRNKENTIIVNNEENNNDNTVDTVEQANKTMTWLMPIMSVSIAVIAPLGLALYWLMSNVLMIIERIILEKFINSKED